MRNTVSAAAVSTSICMNAVTQVDDVVIRRVHLTAGSVRLLAACLRRELSLWIAAHTP